MSARLVVLVSGTGTNLQALIDACADGVRRSGCRRRRGSAGHARGCARARRASRPSKSGFATPCRARTGITRSAKGCVVRPGSRVLAGFMKLAGSAFLERFGGRTSTRIRRCCRPSRACTAPSEALTYGVKVTGATLFVRRRWRRQGSDRGSDRRAGAPTTTTVETLHERIKTAERVMLVDVVGRMVRDGYSINGRKVTLS